MLIILFTTPVLLFLKRYNKFIFLKTQIVYNNIELLLLNTFFLKSYYHRNDLLWQEGLLLDFLQKKVLDKWIRRFLIHSTNLFSERFIFDKIIRFYIDVIIWPGTRNMLFEYTNVSSLLLVILLLLLTILLLLFLTYISSIFF